MDPTLARRDPAPRLSPERLEAALVRLGSVLVLGAVLAQLDATIVTVGLGPMADGLGTSMATVQWVSAGYLLAVAFVAPLSGWLQTRSLTVLGTLPFALDGGTPGQLLPAAALFVRGVGLGAVLPPNVAATYTCVDRSRAPAATSARTVLNRVGGSVGTALLATLLHSALAGTAAHGATAESAYAHTFRWALALGALTLLPAARYPRRAPGKD
ncbi:MFS transporter [Streptomyces collinus]